MPEINKNENITPITVTSGFVNTEVMAENFRDSIRNADRELGDNDIEAIVEVAEGSKDIGVKIEFK